MKATFEFSSLQEIEEYHAYVIRTHPLARITSTPNDIPILEELIKITEPIQHHDHIQPQIPLKYHPLVCSKEQVEQIQPILDEIKKRKGGRPKIEKHSSDQLRNLLEEHRVNKQDFSGRDHLDKFIRKLGMATGTYYSIITSFFDRKDVKPSFKKSKIPGGNATIYKHTGIVRIPTESKPGLKAIQPKGAPAKRAFAPRPAMTDEEWEKEQERIKA